MKLFKLLSILGITSTGLLLVFPTTSLAAHGTSEARVTVRSGGLHFEDMANNSSIIFDEVTITGHEQVISEHSDKKANIVIKDYRGKTEGFYTVLVKDITPSSEPFSFTSNEIKLTLAQTSDLNPSRQDFINVTDMDQEFFTGNSDIPDIERIIPINPKLTIPDSLAKTGHYYALLEWSFIIAEP